MDDQKSLIEALFEKIGHYTKSMVELYKLKAIDQSAEAISSLTARVVMALFVVFFFFILNIGIALWLGEATGKYHYGFFIVAGFYAVVGMVLYTFRDSWIKRPLRNSIITQTFNSLNSSNG